MRGKISGSQLERRAVVYVRQSTTAQIHEHGESTKRQYALTERAAALGWSAHSIDVIDEDLGRSGATSDGRSGFVRLKDGVAGGQIGAIFAIEVSRLARSSQDWQRLLALCAVVEVAVVDENVVYDPADKDDKLLLDIKGTMSEAELHWIGLRMNGARQSKARRGALRIAVPTGYVWGESGLALDPDEAVQRTIRTVFERFAIEPSAWAVVRWARETGLSFPTRRWFADGTSEVVWKPLGASRLNTILNNPIYAGIYAYGRRPERDILIDGEIRRVRASSRDPREWTARIEQAHPGYIDVETFERNQKKLQDNVMSKHSATRGAAREGSALLQGMLICGRCGRRMKVAYGTRTAARHTYICPGNRDKGEAVCWSTTGDAIDRAVEALFLQTMVPAEIELSLAVEREVDSRSTALQQQWKLRLEQAAYEARCAERRYKAVDPDNRVVARTLERDWELRLRELQDIEEQYERARSEHRVELTEADRIRVRSLARELPKVWRARSTPQADRKAMLRLVIEAIALAPMEVPRRVTNVRVQWKAGAVSELEVPRPNRRERHRTPRDAAVRLSQLAADGLRDEQIADRLNEEGLQTGKQQAWNTVAVKWARRRESIARVAPDAPRAVPVPERDASGRYSVAGAAEVLGVGTDVVRRLMREGIIEGAFETYGQYKRVAWLVIDASARRRIAKHTRKSPMPNRSGRTRKP